MFVLDTCLLSEIWKPAPDAGVLDWLGSSVEADLFVSVLTLAELKKGISQLASGKKKAALLRDYTLLRSRFSSRVLEVSAAVAERWGDLASTAVRTGRHLRVVDGLIAATALEAGCVLVTRNVADFESTTVPTLNPWSSR